jgi:hypothetical protein
MLVALSVYNLTALNPIVSIGPFKTLNLPEMFIGNLRIDWQEQIKYLGVQITSHPGFEIDLTERRHKFFMSINCILSKTKFACDLVKLKLLDSYCLSSLMYGLECGILNDRQLVQVNSWWNSVYRKIFGYFKWESVKVVMSSLQKLNLVYTVNLRKILFIRNIINNSHMNNTLSGIVNG